VWHLIIGETMRTLSAILLVSSLILPMSSGAAEPDKKDKTPQQLYKEVGGSWTATDEKASLSSLWLHRNEKAAIPPQEVAEWGIILTFTDRGQEGYRGEPEKVEVDGGELKITLPAPGEGDKRGTRTLRLKRVGDKLEVRVIGGQYAGKYELKRVANKQ
jgi:hypothetical protein